MTGVFGEMRDLKPGQTPTASEFNDLARKVEELDRMSGSGFAQVQRSGGGLQVIDTRPERHYAQITAAAGSKYAHQEVYKDAYGAWVQFTPPDGIAGTVTRNWAETLDFSPAVPVGAVVELAQNPYREGWIIPSGVALPAPAAGSHYARVTDVGGVSGKRYGHVQVDLDATENLIDVPGGVTGTTTAGFARDIGGGSGDLTGVIVLLTPSVTLPGTWLMGPICS